MFCFVSNIIEHRRPGCFKSACNLRGVFKIILNYSRVEDFGICQSCWYVCLFVFSPPLPCQSTGTIVCPELQQTAFWPTTFCLVFLLIKPVTQNLHSDDSPLFTVALLCASGEVRAMQVSHAAQDKKKSVSGCLQAWESTVVIQK